MVHRPTEPPPRRDPFAPGSSPFVAAPGHVAARARLLHAIGSAERAACLLAPAGLGKTTILAEALAEARDPRRRIVRVAAPPDGPALLAELAAGLGRPTPAGLPRSAAWRALADAIRLCRLQELSVVLAIDDEHTLTDPADRRDLDRLAGMAAHAADRLTVLRVGRPEAAEPAEDWAVSVRLAPLTRSEAAAYLTAKLAASGQAEPTFAPAAATRLHALAGGVPRGMDRLASSALAAARSRGLAVIPPDLVEAVAGEWLPAERN